MAFSLSKMTLFSSDKGNAFPWKTFMYTPKQNSFLKSPQPIVGRLISAFSICKWNTRQDAWFGTWYRNG